MKIRVLLLSTCLLLVLLAVACAPAATAAPTDTPMTLPSETPTRTATALAITPTIAPSSTATTSPTLAATATPTVPPGEFKATNWTSSSSIVDEGAIIANAAVDPNKFWIDVTFSQAGHFFYIAVSDDVLTGIDWKQYQITSGYVISGLSDFANSASQGRAIVADFLQSHVNADHHLDAQFASLWSTFAGKHPQNAQYLQEYLFYTLGRATDGKVWVVQVADRSDTQKQVTYGVNPDETLEVMPTPTQRVVKLPAVNNFFFADMDKNGTGGLRYFGRVAAEGVPGDSKTSRFDIVPDPTNSGHGNVIQAIITGPPVFSSHRAYPDLEVPHQEGNYSTQFDFYFNVDPNTKIDLYHQWLSIASVFDHGSPNWHPALMVNVIGSKGIYFLRTRSITPDRQAIEIDNLPNAPILHAKKWTKIRVDVDVYNRVVRTFQDGILVSEGPYMAQTTGIESAHWGAYGTINNGTIINDNISLGKYPQTDVETVCKKPYIDKTVAVI